MVTSACDPHLTSITVGHMVLRALVANTNVGYVTVTKLLKLRKNACVYHVTVFIGLYLSPVQHFDCDHHLTIKSIAKNSQSFVG